MASDKNSSRKSHQSVKGIRKSEEEKLWVDFSSHFATRNEKEKSMRITHHDFLGGENQALPDINHMNSSLRSKLGVTGGGLSNKMGLSTALRGGKLHSTTTGDDSSQTYYGTRTQFDMMPQDRIQRNKLQYSQMKNNSMSIPMNTKKPQPQMEEKLIMRARMRTAQRDIEKKMKVAMDRIRNSSAPKKEFKSRLQIFEDNFSKRKFDERFIYFIQDDQNIFTDNLQFTYVEINKKLCRMVPQKTWESKQAQRMNLYQKIEFAKPSLLLQKQNLLEVLDEINCRLRSSNTKMWMLDGTNVKSLLKIPKQCKILIVGNARECIGLEGLDKFDPNQYERPVQNTDSVKPTPATWIQTATTDWMHKNKAADIQNYMQQVISYKGVDQDSFENDNNLIQSLQAQHKKVHLQDQKLLEKITTYNNNNNESQIDCQDNNFSASPQNNIGRKMTATANMGTSEFYPAVEVEEQLIKFLIEKVIVMREQPFISATETLKEQTDIKKIHNHLKNTLPRHVYTSKTYNKQTLLEHQKKNFDSGEKQFYEEYGQDINVNKVTFKVQKKSSNTQVNTAAKSSGARGSTGSMENNQASQIAALSQSSKIQQQGRMLRNDEIKEICEKHGLSRQEVYQLRSQFASMCMLSETWSPDEANMPQSSSANTQNDIMRGQKGDNKSNQQEIAQSWTMGNKASKAMQPEGIKVGYFVKYCAFLAGCLPHINERILVAHGLDIENQNAVVNWQTFLELYCIFEAGHIEKSHLVKFWIKFFDRKLSGTVPKEEYMTVLEEMVRGSTLDAPTKTTEMFAEIMQKMMKNEGCLREPDLAIIDDKLAEAFTDDRIDIQLLCSALGTKELDSSFIDHTLDKI